MSFSTLLLRTARTGRAAAWRLACALRQLRHGVQPQYEAARHDKQQRIACAGFRADGHVTRRGMRVLVLGGAARAKKKRSFCGFRAHGDLNRLYCTKNHQQTARQMP